jgi:hypothetical protein
MRAQAAHQTARPPTRQPPHHDLQFSVDTASRPLDVQLNLRMLKLRGANTATENTKRSIQNLKPACFLGVGSDAQLQETSKDI